MPAMRDFHIATVTNVMLKIYVKRYDNLQKPATCSTNSVSHQRDVCIVFVASAKLPTLRHWNQTPESKFFLIQTAKSAKVSARSQNMPTSS